MSVGDTVTDAATVALEAARERLLAERVAAGHWEGELSSSSLSTATAVIALSVVDAAAHAELIRGGLRWLIENQNEDGGWGDTDRSSSNISTTLLCWASFGAAGGGDVQRADTVRRAEVKIRAVVGSLDPDAIAETVRRRYGKDRTFSVPILMAAAIGGRLGANVEGWRRVMTLPFELAALPRTWYAAVGLPVVSYALPALIAIGYARYHHVPPRVPIRWIRAVAWRRASRLIAEIQPESGGFIEATPLTSFVVMALAGAGERDHPVVRNGVRFLIESVRPDGSWPIDTNLATWVTTLSVKALAARGENLEGFDGAAQDRVREYLLRQQYREVHPYTDAPAGGWAWTDLSGGVPDADDTPGALLALRALGSGGNDARCRGAAEAGVNWLLNLQNRDGGIPTFCRGWGKLPFDRSSPDLTAHTLRAWRAWEGDLAESTQKRIGKARKRALGYLGATQRTDGSWVPLWFGNQEHPEEENRVYGTAMVLQCVVRESREACFMSERGVEWLHAAQNTDGSWGGGNQSAGSIEETALAVEALCVARRNGGVVNETTVARGVAWLCEATKGGTQFCEAPIGFYFAKLWYYERLYPILWTVGGLGAATAEGQRQGSENS